MKILIETIPHSEQRYPTVGDWQWKTAFKAKLSENWDPSEQVLHIKVSEMSDWRYEALVGLHEAIEALLCKRAGVTEEQVDVFDYNFSLAGFKGEPGNDEHAPYYRQHIFATLVETQTAIELNVNWDKYEKEVNSL